LATSHQLAPEAGRVPLVVKVGGRGSASAPDALATQSAKKRHDGCAAGLMRACVPPPA